MIHIAGTKNSVKTCILPTYDFVEAVQLFQQYKVDLKSNSFQKIPIAKQQSSPTRLIECFAYYMGFLNNVGVPTHKQKRRDPKYIVHFDFLFEQYKTALQINGVDWKILKFTEVNDDMVGFIHDYFLNTLDYANKTYNNSMSLLSAFTTHVITKFKLDYMNPFLGVPDMIVTPKATSIRESEFEKLLSIVTPENGVKMQAIKTRNHAKKKTLYKPWLRNGYKLALFTGGRSEDLVELKWTDILTMDDGKFDTIKTIDHKIDSMNSNRTGKDDRFYKHFAITKELAGLLIEMGYEKCKGEDKYIIAPEDGLLRSHVAEILSKSFSHYYALLKTGKRVKFKDLRKTFMTGALRAFGAASTALTGHATISMTDKHYYDKEVTRDDAKENFSVFPKKKN